MESVGQAGEPQARSTWTGSGSVPARIASLRSSLLWVVRYTFVTSGSVVVSGYAVVDDATQAVVDAGE